MAATCYFLHVGDFGALLGFMEEDDARRRSAAAFHIPGILTIRVKKFCQSIMAGWCLALLGRLQRGARVCCWWPCGRASVPDAATRERPTPQAAAARLEEPRAARAARTPRATDAQCLSSFGKSCPLEMQLCRTGPSVSTLIRGRFGEDACARFKQPAALSK